ncbi:MAG: VOC family protein [Chloroflexi bacterium]|nr:VOC family protein [Chloroflexota bacterium]
MKVDKIDHIHVYVKDLKAATRQFSKIMGTKFSDPVVVEKFNLRSVLEPLGIELIESTTPDGPVARFVEKRGEGLAAISLKVPDIKAATAELKALGMRVVGELVTGGLKEVQFHPGDSHGVMIELCEYEEVSGAVVAIEKGSRSAEG